ncbi:MAG: hypothetical protein QXQ40_00290 [Candidatus Aenigmatarchaeota archaeon]
MGAPYKRVYKHTGPRGHERYVICGFCNKHVPRYKAFSVFRGFQITDPYLRREVKTISLRKKVFVCPQCARHRGIVQIGKSRKSRIRQQKEGE